jgi:hypothetical protein
VVYFDENARFWKIPAAGPMYGHRNLYVCILIFSKEHFEPIAETLGSILKKLDIKTHSFLDFSLF